MKRKHDSMFLKFHHFQHHQQPPHHHNHETSEEDETRNTVGRGGGQTNHHPHHNNNNQDNHEIVVFLSKKVQKDDEHEPINKSSSSGGCGGVSDGATTQIVKRPRGRPPGSKNKPKPNVTQNTIDDECGMRTHLLEIPAGLDIITSISGFSRRQNTGLCVLSGSGTVTNVSLRQPLSITPGATVTFHGRFELLSISATILPPSSSLSSFNGFTISLAGTQGHIFGGSVVGSLIAAGTVFVVASSFHSPSFHRLPLIEDDDDRNSISSGGVGAGSEERESNNPSDQLTDESWSMPMYHHLPSDVIWTPNT